MNRLILWLLFGFCSHLTALKSRDYLAVQSSRCTSRCLQEFVENGRDSVLDEMKSDETVYDTCLTSSSCFECIQPCSKYFSSLPACLASCKRNLFCVYSCGFLNDIKGKKIGHCSEPALARNSSESTLSSQFVSRPVSQETCSKQCKNDFECPSNKKCCKSGCGYTCLPSYIKKSWLPSVVNNSFFRIEQHQGTSVSFSWRADKNMKPWTIFIVQEKKFLSLNIPVSFKSSWQTIRQTPDARVTLVHLKRGYWYKYRVAAVNMNGTRGFAASPTPFRLRAKPQKPPRPVDMSQVSQRVTGGAKYNVLIQWSLPRDVASDLPIKGFQITWAALSQSGHALRHMSMRRYVKASKHTWKFGRKLWFAWIRKLRFAAVYNVSVTTSSGWKNYSVYSQETSLQVSFPALSPKQEISNLRVTLPFYVHKQIASVNVSWEFNFSEAPRSLVVFYVEWWTMGCGVMDQNVMASQKIVKSLSMNLPNLSLNCRYRLSIQTMYGSFRHQWSAKNRIRFDTPPCGVKERRIVATSGAACSEHGSELTAPREFAVGRTLGTSTVNLVELRWKPPIMSMGLDGELREITGYFLYSFNNVNSDVTWMKTKAKVNGLHSRIRLELSLPHTWYTFRLAAVDQYGLVGQEAFVAIRTQDQQ